MNRADIVRLRMQNQHLAGAASMTPGEVVAWFGAVQAQDYLGALWALGLRTRETTEADVEQALADRTIVRTWPMRGTLHFVAAADVRWMLELLTPRVIAGSAGRHRELGLDDATFARARELIVDALQGGKRLTRDAMYQVLAAGDVSPAGQRGIHILSQLAQEGLICFGARAGKQQTFVLLEEWVPHAKGLPRDEALAELARRYFASHGPATLQDFVWWSGLTVADAKAGIESVKAQFVQEVVEEQIYWLTSPGLAEAVRSPIAHLLPMYDEYTVAYRDRSAALDPALAEQTGNGIFRPPIAVDGRIAGTWTRTLKKDAVVVKPRVLTQLTGAEHEALAQAASDYGRFLGRGASLSL